MKKLLNTLYVTLPNSYLSKDGTNVVVSVNQKEVFRIPIINIDGIVAFGYMGCSPGLMKLCVDSGKALSFLSPSGRFIARIQGGVTGNVLLRKQQYTVSESEEKSLSLSRHIIAAKIHNCRHVLMRYERDYGMTPETQLAISRLKDRQKDVLKATSKDSIRGIEGLAAGEYFRAFPNLIVRQKESFKFKERSRRPPKDAVNAMLSFSYNLLANETASALEAVGLDPCVGMFHALRPGRHSLALDVMEAFRSYLCDRFVLTMINRLQIGPDDFLLQGSDSIILNDDARKKFITAWQTRKKESIIHPYLQEKVTVGLLPYIQSMLLARTLRGDIELYPPFLMK